MPLSKLMENAARQLADVARTFHARRILIVCGPGNNGGDGIAMAPLLADESEVTILLSGPEKDLKTPEARAALARVDRLRVRVEVFRTKERAAELARAADLVVDALLGSGTHGDLREPVRSLVGVVNASRRDVLSVDVPTGYGSRTAVRPTVTVALHERKEGMTRANSGRILVRDIGIPEQAAVEVGPADFFAAYPGNAADSHKGQNGRVLVVAGGPFGGAPILAAQGAARSGVDLVRLYTPSEVAPIAQSNQVDLIVHPGLEPQRLVVEDSLRLRPVYNRVDTVLVGPGLGEHPETVEALGRILEDLAQLGKRVVLDADAIIVAGTDLRRLRRLRPMATPHHGEFRELTGRAPPKAEARLKQTVEQAARDVRSVLLVKGAVDVVSDGRRTKINRNHHPAMTVGGTGDVLAGVCAGFWAKGMEPFRAAAAAAFVVGDAGRRVAERQGGSLVASDVVREVPRVFRAWRGGGGA